MIPMNETVLNNNWYDQVLDFSMVLKQEV